MNTELKTWLEEATLDIAQPDVERITREIEAHYTDELEANLARGWTQEQAERAALEALGHPVVARFEFLKSNLTTAQYIELERGLRRSWVSEVTLNPFWIIFPIAVTFAPFLSRGGMGFQLASILNWVSLSIIFNSVFLVLAGLFLRNRTAKLKGFELVRSLTTTELLTYTCIGLFSGGLILTFNRGHFHPMEIIYIGGITLFILKRVNDGRTLLRKAKRYFGS
jgi:hypothetical protein